MKYVLSTFTCIPQPKVIQCSLTSRPFDDVTLSGIPRPVPEYETEIKAILSVPSVAAVMPAYEHETEWTKQVCLVPCPAPSLCPCAFELEHHVFLRHASCRQY